jgi:hypothetical protein
LNKLFNSRTFQLFKEFQDARGGALTLALLFLQLQNLRVNLRAAALAQSVHSKKQLLCKRSVRSTWFSLQEAK